MQPQIPHSSTSRRRPRAKPKQPARSAERRAEPTSLPARREHCSYRPAPLLIRSAFDKAKLRLPPGAGAAMTNKQTNAILR